MSQRCGDTWHLLNKISKVKFYATDLYSSIPSSRRDCNQDAKYWYLFEIFFKTLESIDLIWSSERDLSLTKDVMLLNKLLKFQKLPGNLQVVGLGVCTNATLPTLALATTTT